MLGMDNFQQHQRAFVDAQAHQRLTGCPPRSLFDIMGFHLRYANVFFSPFLNATPSTFSEHLDVIYLCTIPNQHLIIPIGIKRHNCIFAFTLVFFFFFSFFCLFVFFFQKHSKYTKWHQIKKKS